MHHPHRWRAIGLGFFASGALAALAAWLLPVAGAQDAVRASLVIYGSTAILFGGGTALFRHFDARAMDALARGEDLLARWRVDTAAWRAFVARDRQWSQEAGTLPNELFLPTEAVTEGIEVIVGRTAVQVGPRIHQLPRRGTPEITAATLHDGQPPVIELQLYYPGGGHGASGIPRSATRSALRFPVGAEALRAAGMVVGHFRGGGPQAADFFHGTGDGSDPEDLSRCAQCGHETYQLMSHCPQCGQSLQSRRWSRRFGWVLLGGGLLISGVMGWVLWVTGPMLLNPGTSVGGTRFSGAPTQGRIALAMLLAVTAFGVTAAVYGLRQILTGRRSAWMIRCLVGLCAVVLLLALFL